MKSKFTAVVLCASAPTLTRGQVEVVLSGFRGKAKARLLSFDEDARKVVIELDDEECTVTWDARPLALEEIAEDAAGHADRSLEVALDQHQAHLKVICSISRHTRIHMSDAVMAAAGVHLLAARLGTLGDPMGCVWAPNMHLMNWADFTAPVDALMGLYSGKINLPGRCWVSVDLTREGDAFGAVTRGLRRLTGYEIELPPIDWPVEEVGARVVGTVDYLLANGPVLKHGQTLGISEDERFRISLEPDAEVLRLVLESDTSDDAQIEELKTLITALRVPAIAMVPVPDGTETTSWVGGFPRMPEDVDWPEYEYGDGTRIPMQFICQVRLDDCPRPDGLPEFPARGTLSVFFDPRVAPYAEDGDALARGHGVAVLYDPRDWSLCARRNRPEEPDISTITPVGVDELLGEDWSDGIQEEWFAYPPDSMPFLPEQPVHLIAVDSYPTAEVLAAGREQPVDPQSTDARAYRAAIETLDAAREPAMPGLDRHRLPDWRNTLFGARQGIGSRFNFVEGAAPHGATSLEDCVQLFSLQAKGDAAPNLWFGQKLSVWITKDDLAKRDFSKCAMDTGDLEW